MQVTINKGKDVITIENVCEVRPGFTDTFVLLDCSKNLIETVDTGDILLITNDL